MNIIQAALQFFAEHTAIVLLVLSLLYCAYFAFRYIRFRKTGHGFSYRWKVLIGAILVVAVSVYCLITGKSLSQFIG